MCGPGLIGWFTAMSGTVYVVRGGGPETYPGVNRAMAEAYRNGLSANGKLLCEWLKVFKDSRDEFGDRGMDVHCVRNRGVGGACVHGVDDAVDGLVTAGA